MAKIADPVTNKIMDVQYLENVAQSLQQRYSYVEAAIAELQIALSTVKNLSQESGGADLLVPVGGESYVRAKAADVERLIVGIGADIALEKTVKEATEDYQTRIDELGQVRSSLSQEIEKVASNITKARQELQMLARKQPEGT
ncbi:prefoldin subunit alpha [Candidatus Bathyarchaeota archaeon]|nr:prefoldin subunit alpha [Candidatus Bathyarchaeota archaeon]